MTNIIDIRTREGVSATRPGVSGEAREAVFRLLCPYGHGVDGGFVSGAAVVAGVPGGARAGAAGRAAVR